MYENDRTAYGDRPTVEGLIDEEEIERCLATQTTERPKQAATERVRDGVDPGEWIFALFNREI
jgi:hypothetical protein